MTRQIRQMPIPTGARRHRAPATLAFGLALAGVAAACAPATATEPGAASAQPLRCEITLDPQAGGTRIAGTVHADRAVSGTYTMAVTSRSAGGQATIRQSGDFVATPGQPAHLGETRLPGTPAQQHVDLELRVEGQRLTCATL
jgi:hypothetical protein